eukprot:15245987-Heterocapsa_arctica.AAC.1
MSESIARSSPGVSSRPCVASSRLLLRGIANKDTPELILSSAFIDDDPRSSCREWRYDEEEATLVWRATEAEKMLIVSRSA